MLWTEEAEKAVGKVPFFVRRKVRREVEKEASSQGSNRVLLSHVQTCRQKFLSGESFKTKGFRLETCFGSGGCENRAMASEELVAELEKLLAARDFAGFLKERVGENPKMHHEFSISVSDCPNACSRPQIVDIGIIGAKLPEISPDDCTGCGACCEACAEGAMQFSENAEKPVLYKDKCLMCGKCIAACPTGSIEAAREGWRILVGGKLGRHPQLGRELKGIFPKSEVLEIVERCLDLHFTYNVSGERFGALLDRIGHDRLTRNC